MPNTVPLGKLLRLQKCATASGHFVILALDHRNNLRRALNPQEPELVTSQQMATFKQEVVSALSKQSTGVLLDPEFGVAACIAQGAIDESCGLIVAVEQTGYSGDPDRRESRILRGWSVEKIARLGAAGVKLLVYYHPEAPNVARQEKLVAQVGEACRTYELPFFLEPLSYSFDPTGKKLGSGEKRRVVVETARRLTPLGVDILKAEFPLGIDETPDDEEAWASACAELTEASQAPWVLLSAGVGFEDFEHQTRIACLAGASGVIVGRAVWKEAVGLGNDRTDFLTGLAQERMIRLREVVTRDGTPWMSGYADRIPSPKEGWYRDY